VDHSFAGMMFALFPYHGLRGTMRPEIFVARRQHGHVLQASRNTVPKVWARGPGFGQHWAELDWNMGHGQVLTVAMWLALTQVGLRQQCN